MVQRQQLQFFKNLQQWFIKTILLSLLELSCGQIWADAPYLSDDPGPTDYQHWAVYLYSFAQSFPSATISQLPGLEVDWGILPSLEVHVLVQAVGYFGNLSALGVGDIEAGFKYQFISETANRPQVAFAPLFELPTGNANFNLGNGAYWMTLPLWIEKTWDQGRWTSYGGGGYVVNTAAQGQNYFYGGWVLQRNINERLSVGSEIFSQGQINANESNPLNAAFTIVDAGLSYALTKNFKWQMSLGHSIVSEAQWVGYVGIYWES